MYRRYNIVCIIISGRKTNSRTRHTRPWTMVVCNLVATLTDQPETVLFRDYYQLTWKNLQYFYGRGGWGHVRRRSNHRVRYVKARMTAPKPRVPPPPFKQCRITISSPNTNAVNPPWVAVAILLRTMSPHIMLTSSTQAISGVPKSSCRACVGSYGLRSVISVIIIGCPYFANGN